MVSDWLKTQKKAKRTNQILAVLTTKFKKMVMVFCHPTIRTRNNNRKVKKKKTFQKPEHGKKYVFLVKSIENAGLREKYCQQKRGK